MKLMLTIALEYLRKSRKATLKQVFDEIKNSQKAYWKEINPGKLLASIEVDKMGELFTYLSTDSRFVMVDDKYWSLAELHPFEKIKKMKFNIGENKE